MNLVAHFVCLGFLADRNERTLAIFDVNTHPTDGQHDWCHEQKRSLCVAQLGRARWHMVNRGMEHWDAVDEAFGEVEGIIADWTYSESDYTLEEREEMRLLELARWLAMEREHAAGFRRIVKRERRAAELWVRDEGLRFWGWHCSRMWGN